jgi:hypothetical protein
LPGTKTETDTDGYLGEAIYFLFVEELLGSKYGISHKLVDAAGAVVDAAMLVAGK